MVYYFVILIHFNHFSSIIIESVKLITHDIDPLCCHKGRIFCKECILECLLSQNPKSIRHIFVNRKLAAHTSQLKQEQDEEAEKLALQKARELDAFDQQNHGALPQYSDKNINHDRNGFHGANSVKTTSYEEEALRTMKAFWLPSATPDAPVKVNAPSTSTTCPEGKENLKMKSLFSIHFTEDTNEEKKGSALDKTYICPSCKVTLTNTLSLVGLSSCGHVFCKKCADKFVAVDKVCLVCNKGCKERHLINLVKGGTGFAGHGDNLEAKDFKHLGSGSGLGLVRPAQKT
ncbi:putative nitric oxide synthase-interacting protein [Helianthus annuus]|nr:putative nitric oxide synthase-interacting protein [Helianthus annuus]